MKNERSWFGHPPGLTILFLTEMWEKFSYFGMRAMLVYYMTRQLAIGQQQASLIYGLYTGSVMLAPLLGATISDRWLGARRAVICGALIVAVGHFMMAFESLFFPALAIIAAGSGLLLPNLPTQISALYAPGDARRSAAFSVYYVGINTGGILAPLVCGTIGELYGWHWGFTTAGVGMVVGLLIYLVGTRHLPADTIARTGKVDSRPTTATSRHLQLLVTVALIVVVFRGSYEQIGNTIALWAEQGVDRTVTARFTIPMTWFQSLNPLLVFLLTPFVVMRWTRQAKQSREASPLGKMAIGAMLAAAGYFVLSAVALNASADSASVSWTWLLLYFVLVTTGELYLFPIGLALFARMAPAGYAATAVAGWYLAGFAGNLLAGAFGTLWSVLSCAGFFAAMGSVAVIAALLFHMYDRRLRGTASSEGIPDADLHGRAGH